MDTASMGDRTYLLFRQLVAAKLNVSSGADATAIAPTILTADAWMASYPVGSGVYGGASAWTTQGNTLNTLLDNYNNNIP